MVRTSALRVTVAACAAALMPACSKSPEPPPTVSWYLAHPDERQAKVAWCADDQQRKEAPDCRNALAAGGEQSMGRMQDAPALDWNKPNPKKP